MSGDSTKESLAKIVRGLTDCFGLLEPRADANVCLAQVISTRLFNSPMIFEPYINMLACPVVIKKRFDGVVGYHVRLTMSDRERSRVRASVESFLPFVAILFVFLTFFLLSDSIFHFSFFPTACNQHLACYHSYR
jgi:hypothetical protein